LGRVFCHELSGFDAQRKQAVGGTQSREPIAFLADVAYPACAWGKLDLYVIGEQFGAYSFAELVIRYASDFFFCVFHGFIIASVLLFRQV
jgi:hypothetical protein